MLVYTKIAMPQSATVFSTSKSAAQNVQLIFFSEAQRNFCNELFGLVEAQHNSAITEWHFPTKLKGNLISAIYCKFHNTMQILPLLRL